jgi:hypothetical protein
MPNDLMLIGVGPFTVAVAGGNFLVQESDGTSRFDLEADVNDEIILEA